MQILKRMLAQAASGDLSPLLAPLASASPVDGASDVKWLAVNLRTRCLNFYRSRPLSVELERPTVLQLGLRVPSSQLKPSTSARIAAGVACNGPAYAGPHAAGLLNLRLCRRCVESTRALESLFPDALICAECCTGGRASDGTDNRNRNHRSQYPTNNRTRCGVLN